MLKKIETSMSTEGTTLTALKNYKTTLFLPKSFFAPSFGPFFPLPSSPQSSVLITSVMPTHELARRRNFPPKMRRGWKRIPLKETVLLLLEFPYRAKKNFFLGLVADQATEVLRGKGGKNSFETFFFPQLDPFPPTQSLSLPRR